MHEEIFHRVDVFGGDRHDKPPLVEDPYNRRGQASFQLGGCEWRRREPSLSARQKGVAHEIRACAQVRRLPPLR
jgi:hypothetical protein